MTGSTSLTNDNQVYFSYHFPGRELHNDDRKMPERNNSCVCLVQNDCNYIPINDC